MSKSDTKDLLKFLKPFSPEVKEIALWLREFVWDQYPTSNELIYDSYNALAFGWSLTERLGHTFCSVAVMARYCHFGFYWGTEISDPKKLLLGKGNQYRYIVVESKKDFPKMYIRKLLREAYVNSRAKVKDKSELTEGKTITKAIYQKKKRPGQKIMPKKKN